MNATLSTLLSDTSKSVRDPLWNDITLSESLYALYRHPILQQLGRIKQLGPTFHLYPGAVHTRLNHSLGVYHVGHKLLEHLLKQTGQLPVSEQGIASFLVALLVHDLGHFPYAHSLKDVITISHEALGAAAILSDASLAEAIERCGADPHTVALIIDEQRASSCAEIALYRSILSGPLDPDKLDYLNRDAFFCGVPYGRQDVLYIISKLQIASGKLALREEAIASLEHLLFAKYLMYRNVYWHQRTRGATAMIKKATVAALADGTFTEDELFGLDDEQFHHLAVAKQVASLPLFEAVHSNQIYRCVAATAYTAATTPSPFVRHQREEELAAEHQLPPYSIIIDIPESVSFEADMPILTEGGSLVSGSEVEHLFSGPVNAELAARLRKVRIFSSHPLSDQAIAEALSW